MDPRSDRPSQGTHDPPEPAIVTRVLLVDDHTLMREVLVGIVASEPDLHVVGTASDGASAVAMARHTAPDVVVMDVVMPGIGGIVATRELCQELPAVRVLMLSASCSGGVLRQALTAGACGYLLKHGTPEALVEGIRAASRGERTFAPMVRQLLDP